MLKKDLRDQSESVKQRLALRTKQRRHSSVQRLDLSGVNLGNVGGNSSAKKNNEA